jgi:hypothetical protein
MDDLRKVHIYAGRMLTVGGVLLIVVNAMNTTSLLCLAIGISLLVYARVNPAR